MLAETITTSNCCPEDNSGSGPALDDAYGPQSGSGGGALDLVYPKDVSELVDLVLRKVLLIMVLEDVHTLAHEKVDSSGALVRGVSDLFAPTKYLFPLPNPLISPVTTQQ